MLASVSFVDPEDQLFPDVPWEVEVDVRDALHGFVQEAAQEEVRLDGIDVGEADQVADDRRHRRAPPASRRQAGVGPGGAAPDLGGHIPGQLHDVPVDQEKTRQAVTVHQPEFLMEALAGLGLQLGIPVALVQLG